MAKGIKLDCYGGKKRTYLTPNRMHMKQFKQQKYVNVSACNFKEWLRAQGFNPSGVTRGWTAAMLREARRSGLVKYKTTTFPCGMKQYRHHQKQLAQFIFDYYQR
ncbi:hypothetical protein R7O12_03790 [Vibrio sp. Vb1574]|uniref:hypothetical protein n=1 Tax=Vibrio sp. Vb1574 TaxID=3074643 RepID=UPI00296415CB|nr:hypothetical protein [Vibrio sp. Vb1574]MDW1888311.1 hypothetical protein [Vibrio sp. Vb1574]